MADEKVTPGKLSMSEAAHKILTGIAEDPTRLHGEPQVPWGPMPQMYAKQLLADLRTAEKAAYEDGVKEGKIYGHEGYILKRLPAVLKAAQSKALKDLPVHELAEMLRVHWWNSPAEEVDGKQRMRWDRDEIEGSIRDWFYAQAERITDG